MPSISRLIQKASAAFLKSDPLSRLSLILGHCLDRAIDLAGSAPYF